MLRSVRTGLIPLVTTFNTNIEGSKVLCIHVATLESSLISYGDSEVDFVIQKPLKCPCLNIDRCMKFCRRTCTTSSLVQDRQTGRFAICPQLCDITRVSSPPRLRNSPVRAWLVPHQS